MKNIVSFLVLFLAFGIGLVAQDVSKRSVEIDDFTQMVISGSFDVILTQGTQCALKIEADEKSFNAITAEVRYGTIMLYAEGKQANDFKAKVYITITDLKKVKISGAVGIMTPKQIDLNSIDIEFIGATSSTLKINCTSANITAMGASEVKLSGKASDITYSLSGASELKATSMKSGTVTITMDGASEADIYAESMLNATLSGTAELTYKGSPKLVKNVTGGAVINKSK